MSASRSIARSNPQVVVVTGGAGLVGSHLCDALIARGDRVVCVDNLSSGSLDNIHALRSNDRFELIIRDVTDSLGPIAGPIHAVVHLASPAAPADYLARPLETLAAGSFGTRHALELSQRHGARFILASSSEIYGEPLEHPQIESYWGNVNPIGVRSVYDEAKRFAEALTMAWHRSTRSDVGIVRLFNTYGPRMRSNDGRVVSNFMIQALAGRPLTVYGDGSQTRSLCYVDDTVIGLLRFVDSGLVGPMNLGNPDEMSVMAIARLVLDVTGSNSKVVHDSLPEDDPSRRRPDISLAQRLLGWEPTISIREGLARTAEWWVGLGEAK